MSRDRNLPQLEFTWRKIRTRRGKLVVPKTRTKHLEFPNVNSSTISVGGKPKVVFWMATGCVNAFQRKTAAAYRISIKVDRGNQQVRFNRSEVNPIRVIVVLPLQPIQPRGNKMIRIGCRHSSESRMDVDLRIHDAAFTCCIIADRHTRVQIAKRNITSQQVPRFKQIVRRASCRVRIARLADHQKPQFESGIQGQGEKKI